MRPDDRRRPDPPRVRAGARPVPFDAASDPDAPALAALERELAGAGERTRSERLVAGVDRPDPSFVAALRAQLLATYPSGAADDRTAPRTASPTADHRDGSHGSMVPTRRARSVGLSGVPRWSVLAVAAVIVAVLGSASGGLFATPSETPVETRATEAVGASLLRDGTVRPLVDGMPVRAGDEIRVDPGGHATLGLGASLARLDAGADLRLDDLSPDRLRLSLLGGRTYHRVSLPAGGSYVVTTGPVSWTAMGTAFDLEREPTGDARERVTLLGLQHTVGVSGPDLRTTVGEGRAATLVVAESRASDLSVGPIDPTTLDDPWLIANARLDRALGLPLGVLDRTALVPTPSPTEPNGPTEAPSGEPPAPTTRPDGASTPKPTSRPAPRPDTTAAPKPTPKPTPKPLPKLDLGLLACGGGIVIDWSAYAGPHFSHYRTLRNTTLSVPKAWPPEGGASVVRGTYTTARRRTSAHDAGVDRGGTYYYRTMAFDAADRVIGASPVKAATAKPIGDLGTLTVGPGDGTTTAFGWSPYAGPRDCFTRYKLVVSKDDPTPSALEGADPVFASSDRSAAEAIAEIPPGRYHFRLQALRYTALGSPARFVVAQTDVATYTVP